VTEDSIHTLAAVAALILIGGGLGFAFGPGIGAAAVGGLLLLAVSHARLRKP
jgi:hypothetical protein